MKNPSEIFSEISREPFSIKAFWRKHQIGILGTLAFHLIILIILLAIKIQDFKKINSLELVFEVEDELTPEEIAKMEEEKRKAEYFERLLKQQLQAANKAVNIEKLEEEISTEKYVEEYMKELKDQKSEEQLLEEDIMKDILEQEDVVLEAKKSEDKEDKKEFRGPTNISYKFLEEPKDRLSVDIPVPVYKCKGFGEVEVYIVVNKLGNVVSARPKIIHASEDPECLSEIAEKFARLAVFRGSSTAPADHEAIITYSFIAQ